MLPLLNLGYACMNETIKNRYPVSQSCIQKTFETKGSQYAIELALSNLDNVYKTLIWNEKKGIRLYRLSSNMFPHCTNPKVIPKGSKYAYDISVFREKCEKIGNFAKKYGHRLTFHPGQFNVVGTPNPDAFSKTVCELSLHADILDMMCLDEDSVMVVHGGGVYGDKEKTMKRWARQFQLLPQNVRDRLVIENCERSYSALDMLQLSDMTGCPVVFDTHHHSCYHQKVAELPDPSTFLPDVLETWYRRGIKPKFHISEQAPGKRVGAHSDYVEEIPHYLLHLLQTEEIDIMIEAKKKELAVAKLYKKYGKYVDDEWVLVKK